MEGKDKLTAIGEKRTEWEENVLMPAAKRFGMEKRPTKFSTPLDIEGFDFERDVGFPGEYPFTAATYPVNLVPGIQRGAKPGGLKRSGQYSGYGTPEDTRDYYKQMAKLSWTGGPNLALDLPTQCGYDSDNEMVEGEVGKVGVAIDTLRDFEIIFEAFTGEQDLDRIATNITINASVGIMIAMYIALAEKRGIPMTKLRGTPQNDILKEFVSRGTYIYPPRPSMRLFRDSLVFFAENLPKMNITSFAGYHMREGGATRVQDLAFTIANGIAYLQEGVNAGLDIDAFAPRFTSGFGGSMEFFKEIALQRAGRRMWARILKERFGAKKKDSMRVRGPMTAGIGCSSTTKQRALNNLTRSVVGAIAGVLSGGPPAAFPPYDEPLGLGWSLEARQLAEDATRIIMYETGMCDVIDPLAGSYYVESLTNEIEEAAWKELDKIEEMGGAVAAIETGYMQRESAKSAAERQARIERREDLIVGVNCFTAEYELDVTTSKIIEHPYSEEKRDEAEKRQKANLAEVKRTRNNREVTRLLKELEKAAKKEEENLMPHFIALAKKYASLQEQCDVLRGVFGEWQLDAFI
ncbi:MAG: methylmalonyl-CoA mutase family protein [Thermodesulfobacteriota bacterium]|nr:methylmalonyl-CoA mutase family protein [Thermodesulfobacteriota bacterium]